ncbi:MAG: radical SAM family heme chaperone HemW [Chitinophagaceae bacterium]
MPGIYIHIPFCKQACYYCNFHFSTLWKNTNEMIQAIKTEIELQKDFFNGISDKEMDNKSIQTIYLGGGTPSLLEVQDIDVLLMTVFKYFNSTSDCEITLEANPDDVNPEKLRRWKQSGINRFSIGVQSFYDDDLKWMNRSHDSLQAYNSILEIKKAGFRNFSADLIFGIPAQTDRQWEKNIDQMIQLEVPHLSCYALTVEPRTPLYHFIQKKKYQPVNEEQTARQFEMLIKKLVSAGYEHYEISNFSKPGFRSIHNSNYWKGIPYIGIGPSAHSFNGKMRQWNIANNALYIDSLLKGIIPAESEILTPDMQWDEYIMTSLRTMEGCDLNFIIEKWGKAESEKLKVESLSFLSKGQMVLENGHLILTEKGKLFADGIASALFK